MGDRPLPFFAVSCPHHPLLGAVVNPTGKPRGLPFFGMLCGDICHLPFAAQAWEVRTLSIVQISKLRHGEGLAQDHTARSHSLPSVFLVPAHCPHQFRGFWSSKRMEKNGYGLVYSAVVGAGQGLLGPGSQGRLPGGGAPGLPWRLQARRRAASSWDLPGAWSAVGTLGHLPGQMVALPQVCPVRGGVGGLS